MTNKNLQIIKQNLQDLSYVIDKMATIVFSKQLSKEDQQDMNYCSKVLEQVIEKQKEVK